MDLTAMRPAVTCNHMAIFLSARRGVGKVNLFLAAHYLLYLSFFFFTLCGPLARLHYLNPESLIFADTRVPLVLNVKLMYELFCHFPLLTFSWWEAPLAVFWSCISGHLMSVNSNGHPSFRSMCVSTNSWGNCENCPITFFGGLSPSGVVYGLKWATFPSSWSEKKKTETAKEQVEKNHFNKSNDNNKSDPEYLQYMCSLPRLSGHCCMSELDSDIAVPREHFVPTEVTHASSFRSLHRVYSPITGRGIQQTISECSYIPEDFLSSQRYFVSAAFSFITRLKKTPRRVSWCWRANSFKVVLNVVVFCCCLYFFLTWL